MGNKEHAFKQIRHCTTWTNSLTKSSALRFHALLAATYIQHCVSGNFNLQKLRSSSSHRVSGRPCRAGAGGKRPSLRQQQCARCRGKVSKMRSSPARAATRCQPRSGSASARPQRGGARLGSSTDSGPGRCVVAVVADAGSSAREWDITL